MQQSLKGEILIEALGEQKVMQDDMIRPFYLFRGVVFFSRQFGFSIDIIGQINACNVLQILKFRL